MDDAYDAFFRGVDPAVVGYVKDLQESHETLRAKLAAANESVTLLEQQRNEARIEHAKAFEDAADWRRLYTDMVGKLAEVEGERDEALQISTERLEQWQKSASAAFKMVGQRDELKAELDEARRWVAVWKRSARMWREYSSQYTAQYREAVHDWKCPND